MPQAMMPNRYVFQFGNRWIGAMNFYASHGFLDAAAAVYFKDRDTGIENVRIGEDVLRLLVVDGKKIVTRLLFLDYHQPLADHEIGGPVREGRYAQLVSRSVIDAADWDAAKFPSRDLAPFIDWTYFSSYEAFYDQLLARHHGLVRDRERRGRALVAKHGELTFHFDDRRDDVLELAQRWKGDQLREMGYPDIFDKPQTMEFLKLLRDQGQLVSTTLRAGGRLASTWLGFVHEGTWSGWIFAYDPDLRKFSAGHQLLMRMLKESFRLGHREFDFSIGSPEYKMFYATHGRLLSAIGTPSLRRATELFTRKLLMQHAPGVFTTALRAKSYLGSVLHRSGTSTPKPELLQVF